LEPLVRFLIESGNQPARSSPTQDELGFYATQGGWHCDLRSPINFELIEEQFQLPASVKIDRSDNSIFCENSWVEISGGVADYP
jgi:hypothetical protein